MSEPLFDKDDLCNRCGVGYRLPSGTCDHCDAKEPCSACAQKDSEIERLKAECEHIKKNHGCAREQNTTQFCMEAVELQKKHDKLAKLLEVSARVRQKEIAGFRERLSAMSAILEKVPHVALRAIPPDSDSLHWDGITPGCQSDCPAYQWEAMKAKP
jgi:hypothetical protein